MARSLSPQTGRIHLRRPNHHDNDSACNLAADHTISMACFFRPARLDKPRRHPAQCAAPATKCLAFSVVNESYQRGCQEKSLSLPLREETDVVACIQPNLSSGEAVGAPRIPDR